MNFNERTQRIKNGLAQLRKTDPNYKAAHGAQSHRYQLNPVARPQEIQEFEKQHQIVLPEEYRMFLLEVGNGGAGPGYGLLAIRETWGGWGTLNQIFPHTQVWSPGEGETFAPVDIALGRNFDEDEEALWDGSFQIGGEGCDFKNLLVITGTERGHMWMSEMDNMMGFFPYSALEHEPQPGLMFPHFSFGGEGRVGFLDWYEHWLRMTIRTAEVNLTSG